MDLNALLLVLFVFTAWGLDTFVSKLAANRIAGQSSLWYALGFALPIIVYSWVAFGPRGLALHSRSGIGLSILAGALCGMGMIGFLAGGLVAQPRLNCGPADRPLSCLDRHPGHRLPA